MCRLGSPAANGGLGEPEQSLQR